MDDKTIRLQLWDTAGQERFKSLIPSYVKDSTVAVVTYDVTDRATFESVGKWVEDAVSMRGDEVVIIVVGNKTDLTDLRKVTAEEGQKLAQTLNAMFFETSAKEGTNVKLLFNDLAKKLIGVDGEDQKEEIASKGITLKDGVDDPDAKAEGEGPAAGGKDKCNC